MAPQQTLIAWPQRAVASRLLADAEASLGRDPRRTRECLRRLAALIEAPAAQAGAEEAPVRGGLAPCPAPSARLPAWNSASKKPNGSVSSAHSCRKVRRPQWMA